MWWWLFVESCRRSGGGHTSGRESPSKSPTMGCALRKGGGESKCVVGQVKQGQLQASEGVGWLPYRSNPVIGSGK